MTVLATVTETQTITMTNEQLIQKNSSYLSFYADAYSYACCESSASTELEKGGGPNVPNIALCINILYQKLQQIVNSETSRVLMEAPSDLIHPLFILF